MIRGWFRRRRPGRRVVARFGLVEVERLWGVPMLTTGARMRRAGWDGDLDRVRLVVPWPYGCLRFSEVGPA